MDLYTKNLFDAKNTANKILLVKKNNFLEDIASCDIDLSKTFYPCIQKWYKIEGFRAKENETEKIETVKKAAYRLFRSAGTSCSSFVLENKNGETNVLYGTGRADTLPAVFSSTLSECMIYKTDWNPSSFSYSGLLTGTFSSVANFADSFAAIGNDCYVACIVLPANGDEEVYQKIRENEYNKDKIAPYKTIERVYGNTTKRTEQLPVHEVINAVDLLEKETSFLSENAGIGFARSYIRFGSQEADTYIKLKSALCSCIGEAEKEYEPIRIIDTPNLTDGVKKLLASPGININGEFTVNPASWQPLDRLASFCSLPVESHNGFYVKKRDIDGNSLNPFPVIRSVNGITIGSIKNAPGNAAIPLSSFVSHAFVTGSTRTGKTTFVKRTLKELYDQGIPFLVLEAAKKEYIQLLPYIPDLKIYTPGNDGNQLYINPLEPEEGVLIENHVSAVVRAITAATGGEHPIPEALEGLLKDTYAKEGWHYGMMAYHDEEKPFPTVKDAFDGIADYINKRSKYASEISQNLEGAISIRTENLSNGALGSCFSKPFGMTAKDILEQPTLIELADFSSAGVEFLMNILLFKIHCYLSHLPETKVLKRVIVVEEAHNVFRKATEDSLRAGNNDYFEKLLAEVGASGTGMIFSDQRPSIMSDAVIANTAIKIVHPLGSSADYEIMASSLDLSETQTAMIKEFKPGTCLIGLRGIFGVQHASVNALPESASLNPACHICPCRFRCRKAAVSSLLENIDSTKAGYHVSNIKTCLYNPALLSKKVDEMLESLNISASNSTKTCLLGALIQQENNISFQQARIITTSYNNHLKGDL